MISDAKSHLLTKFLKKAQESTWVFFWQLDFPHTPKPCTVQQVGFRLKRFAISMRFTRLNKNE